MSFVAKSGDREVKLFGLLLLVLVASMPRPLVHAHADLETSAFDKQQLAVHLLCCHSVNQKSSVDPSTYHCHWVLPEMMRQNTSADLDANGRIAELANDEALRLPTYGPNPFIQAIQVDCDETKAKTLRNVADRTFGRSLLDGLALQAVMCVFLF